MQYPASEVARVESENAALLQSGDLIPITAIQYPKMDLDVLEYTVNLSLDSHFEEYTGFTLKITQAENKQSVVAQTTTAVRSIFFTQEDIFLDTTYDIYVKLHSPYTIREFRGKFTCSLDVDNSPFVDFYSFETTFPLIVPLNDSSYPEEEPNNTRQNAHDISSEYGRKLNGTIGYSGDIDNFLIVLPNTGYLDICLEVPDGYDYDLYVYNNAGTEIGSSTAGINIDESVRVSVIPGSSYIIQVKGYNGSNNPNTYYDMDINFTRTYSWYSQMSGTSNGITYWSTEFLDNLYFTPYASSTPFMVDGTSSSNKRDLMSEGCFLNCWAMVLRNQNAHMQGFDFRSGFNGSLYANPYTVTLANIGKTGPEVQWVGSRLEMPCSIDPIAVRRTTIASAFGKTSHMQSLSGSVSQKAEVIADRLANSTGGVIVFFTKGSFTHALVIVRDLGPSYSTYERFIVCDPGTHDPSKGREVQFCYSRTYLVDGGFDIGLSSATSMYWVT